MREEKKNAPQGHPKKAYQSPILSRYGSIDELTAGGSGAAEQGKGVGDPTKRP